MEKILLIEDDIEICEMIKQFFIHEGFDLIEAHNGEAGYKIFGEDSFDLVLLDIMLQKLDGFNVIQRIRTNSSLPILILSARDSEFDKVSGLSMGSR
ncbi:hypothetical protein acsn021_05540 [Anaerocolumna cellulosilytica]|uniref:Stage 0 sporulation protein A homolog n=1 Tax=Anaerocolumna cellulosilytica TaxID=433286 RepID=A0A6S6R048_9FIRM|nr:DNA-binding response OmpR family regulator [Anaerocolumna cellulosilytica]BCJ92985.1 hypothetical protein acsn021_05540 [Anaerocolumna cellulosilytica]